ncbi:MAG: CHAP domain-containing protein, partial [Patescibacteria group bacterium]
GAWEGLKKLVSPSGLVKVGTEVTGVLVAVFVIVFAGLPILVLFVIITVSGAFWTSADRGPSPVEAGIYLNEVIPEGSHLAVFVQQKMEECGAKVFTRENSISVGNCLLTKGVDEYVVTRMTESAQRFGVLQCVGFVKAVDPRFIGSGDAYSYAENRPAGWGKVDFYLDGTGKTIYPGGDTIGPGDMIVWGPNKNRCPAGGSCDSNISCCGHIGVVTAVKDTSIDVPGGKTILYVTQAWGNDGRVMTNAVDLNDKAGYTIIGFGKGEEE